MAKSKKATKAKAPAPKAAEPPAATATLEPPAGADFKAIPSTFGDDLDSASKTAPQLREDRAGDIADALFGKEKAGETEAVGDGPLVETVDEEPGATETDGDATDERWEPLALRGAKMGLDADMMSRFETPDSLERFLNVAEVNMAKRVQVGETNNKQTAPRAEPQPKPKPEPEPEPVVGEFKVGEDDFYDAESRQFAEKLAKVANTALREVRELRKQLAVQSEQVMGMQKAHAMSSFDNMIESELGSDWSGILGDGPTEGLAPDSDAFKNRHELVKMVVRLPGITEDGASMSAREVMRRSAAGMWPEQLEKLARGRAVDEVAKRRGVMKRRGKSVPRSVKPEDADAAARATAREFLQSRGRATEPSGAREQTKESLQALGFD